MIPAISVGIAVATCALSAGETWVFVPTRVGELDQSALDVMSPRGTMVAVSPGLRVWSQDDGPIDPADPSRAFSDYPTSVVGMSDDGSRVVFFTSDPHGTYVVWTRGVGFHPVEGVYTGIATDQTISITSVSHDGHSITGIRVDGEAGLGAAGPAMRWFDDGTVEELGVAPGFQGAIARRASADGSVVVGNLYSTASEMHPFVWTQASGVLDVSLPPGYLTGTFLTVSADGSTCGGILHTDSAFRGVPVIWRSDSGPRILGAPNPSLGAFDRGYVSAFTADGALAFVVFEGTHAESNKLHFIWTEDTGLIPAADYVNARIDHPSDWLDGPITWSVADVLDISDDGRTFAALMGWQDDNAFFSFTYSVILTIAPDGECIGDITGDGRTDFVDFNIFATNFGEQVPPGTSGDYTGNGVVNLADFSLLMQDFGCGAD